jgi:hypothetical protein
VFNATHKTALEKIIADKFPNEREIIVFGEFFGPSSFAGIHNPTDPKKFVLFDVLVGHRNPKFIMPREFIKMFGGKVEIPRVIYEGNLSDQFIKDVRENKYPVFEGVICKGLEKSGAFCGGTWMCKIKTQKYFDFLKDKFGADGCMNHWE